MTGIANLEAERISNKEVGETLRMENEKVAGPDNIPVELWNIMYMREHTVVRGETVQKNDRK